MVYPVGSSLSACLLDQSGEVFWRQVHLFGVEPHASLLLVVCAEQQHKLLEVARIFAERLLVKLLGLSGVFVNGASHLKEQSGNQTSQNVVRQRVLLVVADFVGYGINQAFRFFESLRLELHALRVFQRQQFLSHRLHVETHVANQVQVDHSHLHRTVVDARRPHYLSREIDVERSRFQVEFFRIGGNGNLAPVAAYQDERIYAERMHERDVGMFAADSRAPTDKQAMAIDIVFVGLENRHQLVERQAWDFLYQFLFHRFICNCQRCCR